MKCTNESKLKGIVNTEKESLYRELALLHAEGNKKKNLF